MLASRTPIPRNRRLALTLLCTATLMAILDDTVANVALPSIQRDLDFSTSNLSWVINAYLVAFGGLLLLAGRLGDLIGRRRVLLSGVATFTVASALVGLAPSPSWLVAARFFQGAGGALATSVALGMVVSLFDDPRVQARAVGIYTFVGASGASAGLFLGGVITDVAGWRWAFFINIPIGIVTLVAGRRVLANDSGVGLDGGADAPGAALLVTGVMVTIVAVVDERLRLLGALGIGLLGLFVVRQSMAHRPLVPPRLLRSRHLVGANLVMALLVAAMFGFQFTLTLYFQRVLGFSPAEAGLGVLPIAGGIAAMSLFGFPRLSRRFEARNLLAPALAAIVAAMALLTRAPVNGQYLVDIAPSVVLFGLGGGILLPAVMTVAMSGVKPETAGVLSGLINSSQQIGGAVGLAFIASIAAARTTHLEHDHAGTDAALVGGFHVGWAVGTGLLLVALAVAVFTLSRRDRPVLDASTHGANSDAAHNGRPLVRMLWVGVAENAPRPRFFYVRRR